MIPVAIICNYAFALSYRNVVLVAVSTMAIFSSLSANELDISSREVVEKLATGNAMKSKQLPDWSGVWAEVGNTVFDHTSVEPQGGSANTAGTRERPPFRPDWEELYLRNIALVAQGRFLDPVSVCGTPAGFPRVFNLPDVYEFVVRPEQTWIITENGPNVMRIKTDGRNHPAPDDLWLTYTGDSVGYWEGAALIFSTVSVKNDGTILDRTGLTLSNEMTAITRMRQVESDLIELEMVIDDPLALFEPWRVTMHYERLPAGTGVYDYSCTENNRNPVSETGLTITLGPNGKPLED